MTVQSMQEEYLRHQKLSRKSRRVYDFSVTTLRQYSCMRQDDAAKVLGVAPITLKRICQRRNYRWPYRSVKAAEKRRERQHAAAIAAAIAAGATLTTIAAGAEARNHTVPVPVPVPVPTPTPSTSPTRQFIGSTHHHHNHELLARQFPHGSASSSMDLTTWLTKVTSPSDPRSSPPSTALSSPVGHPMSPLRNKTATSPLSELSLGYSSMSLTSTRLPPLRVALHPSYLAVREHEQRASTELLSRCAWYGRDGGASRPSTV